MGKVTFELRSGGDKKWHWVPKKNTATRGNSEKKGPHVEAGLVYLGGKGG